MMREAAVWDEEPDGPSVSILSNETIARMLLDRGVSEELVIKHILGGS